MPTRTVNLESRTLQGTIHMLLFVSILFGGRQGKGSFGATNIQGTITSNCTLKMQSGWNTMATLGDGVE
jgi:hypothetical protein